VIRLCELRTGAKRQFYRGHTEAITSLVFSPDGRFLISGSDDATGRVWDTFAPTPRACVLGVVTAWDLLSDVHSGVTHDAISALVLQPAESVAFLTTRLRLRDNITPQRLQQLISDLDSETFQVREEASRLLGGMGDQISPFLQRVLEGAPSLEVRRRVVDLLTRLNDPIPPPDHLRWLRAIEALERIDTLEAKHLLQRLSTKDSPPMLQEAAKAAIERLDHKLSSLR
jgi:HEAT repeat protein